MPPAYQSAPLTFPEVIRNKGYETTRPRDFCRRAADHGRPGGSAAAPGAAPGAAPPGRPRAPLPRSRSTPTTTREQLQEILRQYPPAVGEVLRRDTSLLARPDYIAPYPQLVAFLQQHPEVTRNPSFFFGGYDYYERRQPLSPEVEALGRLARRPGWLSRLRRLLRHPDLAGARGDSAPPLAAAVKGPNGRSHEIDGPHEHQRRTARLHPKPGRPPLPGIGPGSTGGGFAPDGFARRSVPSSGR